MIEEQNTKKEEKELVVEKKEETIIDAIEKLDMSYLDNAFIHVKVGSKTSSNEQIDDEMKKIEIQLNELAVKNNINCLFYVTHPFVEINVIAKKDKEGS